ncbi:esterase/lipase/thioesterase [Salpingoeca rosetta]|uniref:Esterase/lipase/thioesterase n=1 Tax=Salpingoeca rosetta (strain ATCC 50818 / BSB-021) TaxID=946362 RepID=F2UQ95_SALR5|nr:esterase/lipase/thioesterase [Salpingoeca rosetta]EGD79763.1 esterase/lipase/thioesterase [Salpingoeca rosetta]|eukprot:XP_004988712.1 esterase/lipase/thioesterase [Salpingoeca rosetta]
MPRPQRALGDRPHFVNRRGQRLHYVTHNVDDAAARPPRALLIVVHGFGHHIEACIEQTEPSRFTSSGIAVAGFSFHGHGYSDGRWVHVRRYEHLVEDLADFHTFIVEHLGLGDDVPVFMSGESMGGAVVLLASRPGGPLDGKVAGCMYVAPMCAISPDMMIPQWQINALRVLMAMMPIAAITPIEPVLNRVFKDPKKLEEALADTLVWHKRPRLRTAWEMREATLDVQQGLDEYTVPFLVMHGGADTVTDLNISRELHTRASATDKTIKVYDGYYHALLAEPDGGDDVVRADMVEWILARAGGNSDDDGASKRVGEAGSESAVSAQHERPEAVLV